MQKPPAGAMSIPRGWLHHHEISGGMEVGDVTDGEHALQASFSHPAASYGLQVQKFWSWGKLTEGGWGVKCFPILRNRQGWKGMFWRLRWGGGGALVGHPESLFSLGSGLPSSTWSSPLACPLSTFFLVLKLIVFYHHKDTWF